MTRGAVNRLAAVGVALAALLVAAPSGAQEGEACAEAIRAIMTDFRTERPPVKHTSVTRFGDQETVSISWATGFNQGMSGDAEGTPVSLFREGAFYTSEDGGQSWTLARRYSEQEVALNRFGLETQARYAEGFACEDGASHEGRSGSRYSVRFTLHSTQTPVEAVYWVDPDSGFVWRTETSFETPGGPMQVIQDTEPAPDFVLPDPEG